MFGQNFDTTVFQNDNFDAFSLAFIFKFHYVLSSYREDKLACFLPILYASLINKTKLSKGGTKMKSFLQGMMLLMAVSLLCVGDLFAEPPPMSSSASCDDKNKCTVNDTIQSNGKCKGKIPTLATPAPCMAWACNKFDGVYSQKPKINANCNDGNSCTVNDKCDSKAVCVGNPKKPPLPPLVPPLAACEEWGQCDPKTGNFSKLAKPDGTVCDDKAACTDDDKCTKGVCQGSLKICGISDGWQNKCDLSSGECKPVYQKLSTGPFHTCGIFNDGLYCWGDNSNSQLGVSYDEIKKSFTPLKVELDNVIDVVTCEDSTCAVTSDGSVWCWGKNFQNGLGTETPLDVVPQPTTVWNLKDVVATSASHKGHCAISANGDVYCWGDKTEGKLGKIEGISAIAISGTGTHACAITKTGVKCWGLQVNGSLGNSKLPFNTGNKVHPPVDVDKLGKVVALSVGSLTSCAVNLQGEIWCWGRDIAGSAYFGKEKYFAKPTQVPIMDSAMATTSGTGEEEYYVYAYGTPVVAKTIGVGHKTACAADVDDNVWCWGDAPKGEISQGANIPARIKLDGTTIDWAKTVVVGWEHACVADENEKWKCWGANDYGQLGIEEEVPPPPSDDYGEEVPPPPSDDYGESPPGDSYVSKCGNGYIDAGEKCDGANLGGATCETLNWGIGTPKCGGDCTYYINTCNPPPPDDSY